MIPENLVFLQVVPHDLYFQWQIEVQITNFRKFGVSDKMEIVVWHRPQSPHLKAWHEIQNKYPEVTIYPYEDAGVNLGLYISQLRPHSLKKHFFEHKERLEGKVFFYHDSDIIFRELPDFEKLVEGDVCWQSDCSHYLDYNYLRAKEEQGKIPEHEAIQILADIGKVSVDTIKSYTGKTGGAQTILRNLDSSFWEDIEHQCLQIRQKFTFGQSNSVNSKYFKSENEGFQSWCADMWALNFAQWSRGMVTDVTPLLDFSWASDNYDTYLKKPIFHNAGATGSSKDIFYKGAWINKSPIGVDLPMPAEDKASRAYVQAIKDVKL